MPHRLIARGEWTPVDHGGGSGVMWPFVFQLALLEAVLLRSIGYAVGDQSGSALGSVEQWFPLASWAGALLGCLLLVGWGMIRRQFSPIIMGHGALAALYMGLGAGLLHRTFELRSWEALGTANGLIVLGGVFHLGFCVSTAGRQRRRELEAAHHG